MSFETRLKRLEQSMSPQANPRWQWTLLFHQMFQTKDPAVRSKKLAELEAIRLAHPRLFPERDSAAGIEFLKGRARANGIEFPDV